MQLARAWHQFRDAEPGHRFCDTHARLKRAPTAARVALWLAGSVLIAGGVVLVFIPGPGSLAIVLGLAMLTGVSRRLASVLDLGELRFREWRNER